MVAVYPRVCGGTGLAPSLRFHERGLSPRVRRHPDRRGHRGGANGSISACAEAPPAPHGSGTPPEVYLRVCGGTP